MGSPVSRKSSQKRSFSIPTVCPGRGKSCLEMIVSSMNESSVSVMSATRQGSRSVPPASANGFCQCSAKPLQSNVAPANASAGFGWFEDGRYQRKRREIRANASKWFDAVLIGDSITHNWESEGLDVYQRLFAGRTVLNIGFGGDRVQGALWTCGIGGLLDGYRTGLVSVMIGTNNTSDPPEDVAAGIVKLLGIVRRKQPDARILLHAIMPRGAKPNALRSKNDKVNALVRRLADGRRVIWVDFGDRLMDGEGNIPKALLYDFLHPTEKGYEIWADALRPHLVEAAK